MKVTPSPSGTFYIATFRGLTVFDENRVRAITRLTRAITKMNQGAPK